MDIMTFKCPNCGGNVLFNSSNGGFQCESCDTQFTREQLEEYEQTLEATKGESKQAWHTDEEREQMTVGSVAYICEFCGAEIVGDSTTAATECVYCGSPIIMKNRLSGMDKPDSVIPFKLKKEDAKAALKNFYKGKRLLPNEFKNENRIEKISSVYVPFWLFDCDVDASIRYSATRNRTWSDKKYIYTKTSHYSVLRSGNVSFERIPADASSKMEDRFMDAIEPFDYSEMKDFTAGYLSGYLADKYDVTAADCEGRITERVNTSTREMFRNTVNGYDSVSLEDESINVESGKAKYVMFPVWMLSTKYKGKPYTFAMNGQTGKLVGELPVDKKKYWTWLLGIAAGIVAVGQLIVFFL